MSCICRSCKRSRRTDNIKYSKDPSLMAKLIDELHNDLECADMDLDFYQAIFNGSWPSARRHGERIIERCNQRIPEPFDREVRA